MSASALAPTRPWIAESEKEELSNLSPPGLAELRVLVLVALVLGVLVLAGCAPALAPVPAGQGMAASAWEIPQEELGTQRLLRVRFRAPEGEGRFRLTLRLESAERFQLAAVDPLGRGLWTLFSDGAAALLLDHANRRACTFGDDFDLARLSLGSFPLRSLPAVVLGRVPGEPTGGVEWLGTALPGVRRLSFEDGQGRRWEATVAAGLVTDWRLYGEAGEALAAFSRGREEWRLEDRRSGLELHWRETLGEPLGAALAAPTIPSGYERGGCLAEEGSDGI